MTRLVRHDGLLDYAALCQELRARLMWVGVWECTAEEQKTRIDQVYWVRVWTWILIGLSVVVAGWVIW